MIIRRRRDLAGATEKVSDMTDLRGARWARGFALLIRPWPPVEKYPKPRPGLEREQIAAKFEGNNAIFLLLAAGWNP